MSKKQSHLVRKIPDFDVLSEEPDNCALIVKESLIRNGFNKVKIVKHDSIGEIIPEHDEIIVGNETMAFIYKPIACHNYNTIVIKDKEIHIATIDTILSFYLAFLYANIHNYNSDRLLCMAKFLFDVEQKNRLEQKGLLKRFSMNCYGKQPTLEEMRSEKAMKYKELKNTRGKEYENWFLKYAPGNNISKTEEKDDEISEPVTNDEYVDDAKPENKKELYTLSLFKPTKTPTKNPTKNPMKNQKRKTFRQRLEQRRKTLKNL